MHGYQFTQFLDKGVNVTLESTKEKWERERGRYIARKTCKKRKRERNYSKWPPKSQLFNSGALNN
jgi:hypothetical protein